MSPNSTVTTFLDELNHPFRKEIEALRMFILQANSSLSENIKWNGPNYSFKDQDRITMRIQPPKQLQLIFHRGAKVLEAPKTKLITEDFGMLAWKANDRAVATFKNINDIVSREKEITRIVQEWIETST
jgi:hypothetical protein